MGEGNKKYEDKFGYIFIVCATGKTAEEMLVILESRLSNDPVTEIDIAADEQNKITKLRLEKLLE
ncbi:MAG: 2-oxo-4-hydroxy-4-carboxy-5-ureidoimidazoline decarboxylase [Bacteroidota bacterium]